MISSIAIIGARGIPMEFSGTSGIEAYIQHKLESITKGSRVSCYIRSWTQTDTDIKRYKGAILIPIWSINSTHLDTISYSFFASLHAAFSSNDIVWYHGVGPAFFSFIPRFFGKKIHTTIHSFDWERKKWGLGAKIFLLISERVVLACSHNLYAVSIKIAKRYKHIYKRDTILDVYSTTKQHNITAQIITKKYGLRKNNYILFLGRFVPEKRIEWLIRASDDVSVPIVLAGGSSHSDIYTKTLYKLAKSKKIIFTGYVFGREKRELISNCRLFVLPSNIEGYPISVAEALSYDKNCLVGDFLRDEYKHTKRVHFYRTNDYSHFKKELQLAILSDK